MPKASRALHRNFAFRTVSKRTSNFEFVGNHLRGPAAQPPVPVRAVRAGVRQRGPRPGPEPLLRGVLKQKQKKITGPSHSLKLAIRVQLQVVLVHEASIPHTSHMTNHTPLVPCPSIPCNAMPTSPAMLLSSNQMQQLLMNRLHCCSRRAAGESCRPRLLRKAEADGASE